MKRKQREPVETAESKPLPDEIAQLAYQMWLREGEPAGMAEKHWLAAEQELLAKPNKEAPASSLQQNRE